KAAATRRPSRRRPRTCRATTRRKATERPGPPGAAATFRPAVPRVVPSTVGLRVPNRSVARRPPQPQGDLMFTKGTWSRMIAGATVLAAATAAMAGVLAPSKASQSVVLRTNGVSTGCGGTSLAAAIDTQILSNGSTAPFTIPPGDVLVLDG